MQNYAVFNHDPFQNTVRVGRTPTGVELKKLIVMAPYADRTCLDLICHVEDAVIVKTWTEVLSILEKDFPGPAKVAVLQDGTMQYLKS